MVVVLLMEELSRGGCRGGTDDDDGEKNDARGYRSRGET